MHASGFLERDENHLQLSFGIDATTEDAKAKSIAVSRQRQVENESLREAIDEVRRRFGRTSVGTASELGEGGLDVVTQRGRHAFGPESGEGVTRER